LIYAGDLTPADRDDALPGNNGQDETPAIYVKPPKPEPKFTCIQTGEALEKDRVLRFVIGPENTLYPDFAENLPGTAMWCNLYRPTIEAALKGKVFGDVIIPDNMMEQIERGLRHQALSMLSMTKKAGQLMTGAEKTEGMLKSGKASIYLTSSSKDGDTRQTLTFHAQANNAKIVDFFTSDELSKASGANKVVHAAMGRGGTAKKFFVHVKRMNLFNQQTPPNQQEE
jgi:predicted RNA-binding protein YlxR (DUF448 family)